ncbi:MAG: type IV secretion system DNA-binding domain-containing protein, partial [Candidatus Peribacteraceae bacterium]|nr:type IV secretion system DNA-binding domain-containing protein [Candidatus Peribacteraceae bacterium]
MDFVLLLIGILAAAALGWGILWFLRFRADLKREQDLVFLQLLVPKKESKEDKERESEKFSTGQDFKEVLGVMDHLYQSLHSLHSSDFDRFWKGHPFFSMEYAALAGEILFFVVCPRKVAHLIEKQFTSFYPDTIIDEVEDYNIFTDTSVVSAQVVLPKKPFTSVFRTYQQLKSDPLNTITNAFSKLKISEGAAIQFVLTPADGGWQKKLQDEAIRLINPKKKHGSFLNPLTWLGAVASMFLPGSDLTPQQENQSTGERVSQMAEEYSKAVDEKAGSPGFHCVVRIVTSAETQARSKILLETVLAAFAQFDDVRGNSFRKPHFVNQRTIVERFIRRSPRRSLLQAIASPKMLLGASELTSFFHLPNTKYNKVETIKWQNFKIATSPKDIPEEGLFLGINSYRGEKRKIFMKNEDRFRHFYIIGQTGTGKSSILQIMARQDFHQGKGMCVVDPHGSLIEDLLPYIPRERADDVIYFNPADTERPMGLNLLEGKTPEEKDLIALDAMNMMVKMFGNEVFGPRIQDYFRNGCLTLMDDEEEGGAITDLVKLFTDEEWQKYKVSRVKNPIVRSFWEKQMTMTGQREKQEMIPYFAAKFGQFTTNTLIRNIVGQTKSAFDISEVMNSGKILLANLSKGLIGDINSQLLGMMFVNKIQVAAMRRQQQDNSKRRDFFLYIDEFQN